MRELKFILVLFILTSSFQILAVKLELPLDCTLGKDCWISNLPRHYSQDKQVDFRCGQNTYSDHKGTDFALKDYKQMYQGVKVLVPFDGEVKGLRNHIPDISVRDGGKDAIKGIECGNGLVIANGDYEAQLCHLKQGSIKVKKGQFVKAGDVVGMVGLSGKTEYPHLHMSLRKNSREIDPFYGDQEGCGEVPESMWKDHEKMDSYAKTGVVYNYGFTFNSPNVEQIRRGQYVKVQPEYPQALVGFVDVFSVNKGDKLVLSIIDSAGKTLVTRDHEFGKYQARYFFFIGKSLRGKRMSGQYKLNIKYYHEKGGVENFEDYIKL